MIAICPNPYRDTNYKTTLDAVDTLKKSGYEVAVCPVFTEDSKVENYPFDCIKLRDIADRCSLAVAVGGDGTILSVTRQLTDKNVPVFGINMGTMGFLCSVSPDNRNWTQVLLNAASGMLYRSSRMMLDAQVIREGRCILSDTALNDIVVHGYGECVNIHVYIDGNLINSINGDGIAVASPTGSTGYSVSAGGPIVEPTANNLIITPICAHSLSSRSYVFSPDKEVKLIVERQNNRKAYLASDGYNLLDINNNDCVIIRRSQYTTDIYEASDSSFYSTIAEKLY